MSRGFGLQIGQSRFVNGKHMSHSHAIRTLFCGFLLSTTPLAAGQAHGTSAEKAKAGSVSSSAKEKMDVCMLLSGSDIETVQGEPVKETKRSTQPSGGVNISQNIFPPSQHPNTVPSALLPPPRTSKACV